MKAKMKSQFCGNIDFFLHLDIHAHIINMCSEHLTITLDLIY